MALTFSGITHMTNYWYFLWYFQACEKCRKFQLLYCVFHNGQMAFHADVLGACALDGWHVMYMPCTPENNPQCILTPIHARLNTCKVE